MPPYENQLVSHDNGESDSKQEKFLECTHACLEAQGHGSGCNSCQIRKEHFCPHPFIKELIKWKNKLGGLSVGACQDILAETVSAIIKNISQFDRRSQFSTWAWRIFSNKKNDYWRKEYEKKEMIVTTKTLEILTPVLPTEVLNILNNNLNKHFSSQRSLKELLEKELGHDVDYKYINVIVNTVEIINIELPDNDEPNEPEMQEMLKSLYNLLPYDKSNCIELILEVYFLLAQGKTIKEIAEEKNIKPNTLIKQKERCTETIKKMLEQEECF